MINKKLPDLPTSFLVPISSKYFNLRKKTYNLHDGISIETFPKHKVQSIADRLQVFLTPDDNLLIDMSNIYLYAKFLEPEKIASNEEWSKIMNERLKKIKRMLLALFLTKYIDLWANPVLIFHGLLDNHSPYYSREYLNLYRLPGIPTDIINDKDLLLTIEIYKRINKISPKRTKSSRLYQAITFYWLARTTENLDFAFVSYVISLESLLLTGGQELIHKFSERGAFLLDEKTKNRFSIYKKLHKAYRFRSEVVHGTLHLQLQTEEYILMLELINIVRQCIKKILLDKKMIKIFSRSSGKATKNVEDFFKYLICGYSLQESANKILNNPDQEK